MAVVFLVLLLSYLNRSEDCRITHSICCCHNMGCPVGDSSAVNCVPAADKEEDTGKEEREIELLGVAAKIRSS